MPEPSEGRGARPAARAARSLHERLVDVLCDVRYPAERWEIIAGAAARGADRVTAYRLARLPYRTYPDLDTVLGTVLDGVAQVAVPRPGHADPA
ncbi:DUF2795 domain-containing protein [Pseudonocardia kujensis]|uniref:DUF2795 domain-containing protein n=1 Tax=Pseudonocardia kujensis TaxID=1128675 RepID=UPI001E4C66DD|nr:DUF2795 domain-containing protein [Pseudonocardia kujensis]MCE0766903.1 DUF2795 domain-containing protein [Pseudonocardia kujensis]